MSSPRHRSSGPAAKPASSRTQAIAAHVPDVAAGQDVADEQHVIHEQHVAAVDIGHNDTYDCRHAGRYASRIVSRRDVADHDDAPGNRVIDSSASNGWFNFSWATHSAFSDAAAALRRSTSNRSAGSAMLALALCCLLTAAVTTSVDADDYVIASGDSLWLIAELHGVSVADLQSLNGLSDGSTLTVGDRLLIPDPPWTGPVIDYIVAPGDALSLIAEAHDVATADLLRLNNFSDASIQVGQVVLIPDTTSGAVDAPAAKVDDGWRVEIVEYIVEPGDALSVIAETYDVAMAEIVAASALDNANDLQVGSVLSIPTRIPVDPIDVMAEQFEFWANANELDPNLLKALGWQESRWQEDAVSYAGAVGVTQIMPYTADFITDDLIGQPLSRENADDNIRMGARYLAYLLELTGGDEDWALAAYYQGFTDIAQNGLRQDTMGYVASIQSFRPRFASADLPLRPESD